MMRRKNGIRPWLNVTEVPEPKQSDMPLIKAWLPYFLIGGALVITRVWSTLQPDSWGWRDEVIQDYSSDH